MAKTFVWTSITGTPGVQTSRENRFPWTLDEREKLSVSRGSPECAKGIWSTRIERNLNLTEILLEPRGENCFFIEYHEGMSFQGADELHRLRNDNRQLKKSYRYTQWGLGIAAGSLFFALLFEVLKFLFSK